MAHTLSYSIDNSILLFSHIFPSDTTATPRLKLLAPHRLFALTSSRLLILAGRWTFFGVVYSRLWPVHGLFYISTCLSNGRKKIETTAVGAISSGH
jgi:hypothetical protein